MIVQWLRWYGIVIQGWRYLPSDRDRRMTSAGLGRRHRFRFTLPCAFRRRPWGGCRRCRCCRAKQLNHASHVSVALLVACVRG